MVKRLIQLLKAVVRMLWLCLVNQVIHIYVMCRPLSSCPLVKRTGDRSLAPGSPHDKVSPPSVRKSVSDEQVGALYGPPGIIVYECVNADMQ